MRGLCNGSHENKAEDTWGKFEQFCPIAFFFLAMLLGHFSIENG